MIAFIAVSPAAMARLAPAVTGAAARAALEAPAAELPDEVAAAVDDPPVEVAVGVFGEGVGLLFEEDELGVERDDILLRSACCEGLSADFPLLIRLEAASWDAPR
ncbi:MAG: hypothetical protein M0T79_09730 [Actinomycetota bacterium]|nr:hypothetical protein [Actinomycetota bacterium]